MREGVERGEPGWNEWEQTRLRLFHEEGRVCFDLFAPLTAEIFSRSRRIRNRVASRYPLVLIDDTQDTGNDQWACARALAEKSQLVCLADLDQLIFDHLPGVGPDRHPQDKSISTGRRGGLPKGGRRARSGGRFDLAAQHGFSPDPQRDLSSGAARCAPLAMNLIFSRASTFPGGMNIPDRTFRRPFK